MSNNDKNPWTLLGSREIYRNPWIRVREDQVLRPDKKQGIYGVIEFQSLAIGIVPVTDDMETVLTSMSIPGSFPKAAAASAKIRLTRQNESFWKRRESQPTNGSISDHSIFPIRSPMKRDASILQGDSRSVNQIPTAMK
jgi:hypothetical protein